MFELTLTNNASLHVTGRIVCMTHIPTKKYTNIWIDGSRADPFSVKQTPAEIKALMGFIRKE